MHIQRKWRKHNKREGRKSLEMELCTKEKELRTSIWFQWFVFHIFPLPLSSLSPHILSLTALLIHPAYLKINLLV